MSTKLDKIEELQKQIDALRLEEESGLEVGKWYWSDMGGLWCMENVLGSKQVSYGVSRNGQWCPSANRYSTGCKPATRNEVEAALTKEAKSRGFVEGAVYTYPDKPHIEERVIVGEEFIFHQDKNKLTNNSSWIFDDGEWTANLTGKTIKTKSELEVGEWHKCKSDESLIYLLDYDDFDMYGFQASGNWFDRDKDASFSYKREPEEWRPATTEEVETALLKEAKKRGFKEGVTIINVDDGLKTDPEIHELHFAEVENALYDGWGSVPFDNGEWAEILEEKLPKIGCREGEVTERHIKYGDRNLSKKTLKQMQRAGITAITIDHGSESFYVGIDDMKSIYKAANE